MSVILLYILLFLLLYSSLLYSILTVPFDPAEVNASTVQSESVNSPTSYKTSTFWHLLFSISSYKIEHVTDLHS